MKNSFDRLIDGLASEYGMPSFPEKNISTKFTALHLKSAFQSTYIKMSFDGYILLPKWVRS
ncbi:hypothetical protein ALQ05_200097 [Pseudomonas amygdali pv. mori]|uniref:Uncharacterized protein n=1 Tax=Pseudomonas amygdali pv. mori TaxID=34065 RepID=A0A3M4L1F5_PSEA0|nr:hypothetical protein ALQ05_200097 [Pseudomonas amygdali pv. mori]